MRTHLNHTRKSKTYGFALIVTLIMMTLLVILSVGLLSLSAISLRTTERGDSAQKARCNARLALMVAIGDLQKLAGPDTRITASSEAVAGVGGSRYVTGIWRSWEGNDHDKATGLPIAPDYAVKTKKYEEAGSTDGRFLGWLLSGAEKNNAVTNPPSVAKKSDTVPLLSGGTLGIGTNKEVHLVPTEIGDDGAYAWWVQGENSKALIGDAGETPTSDYEWAQRLASDGQPDVKQFGFDDQSQLALVSSRKTMDLASNSDTSSKSIAGKNFHEMTARSRGLLTNTANGGWRRDLSLLTEQWADITLQPGADPTTSPRMFTLSPGVEAPASKDALIYPWASEQDYRVIGSVKNGNISKKGGASVSWNNLADYALKYKDNSSGKTLGPVKFPLVTGGRDSIGLRPVFARFHWVFSYGSEKVGDPTDDTYQAYLVANPVFTLWNPYNVELEDIPEMFSIRITEPLPYGFQFKVGNTTQSDFFPVDRMAKDGELTVNIRPSGSTWKPGESRVYSGGNISGGKTLALDSGFRPTTGFKWLLYRTYTSAKAGKYNGVDPLIGKGDDPFTVELQKYSPAQFTIECYRVGGTPMAMEVVYELPDSKTNAYWPEITVKDQNIKLKDVDVSAADPSPFLVGIMQHRGVFAEVSTEESTTARGYSDNKHTFLFSSPRLYNETFSPEPFPDGFPYDWLFFTPNDINDTEGMPQASGSNNDIGYVGTGFRADLGLVNLVTSEIPVRPMSSLGELQHFDINYYNPLPPYTSNAIGNSRATFAIKPDQVFIDDGTPQGRRSSFDHSYVANHLFFDDWFVSSITPDGSSSVSDVYQKFVSGEDELVNRSYRPAKVLSSSEAQTEANEIDSDKTSWHSVGSKIEVEGMFNVNSTSVEAWSALLKHLDGASVPYLSVGPSSWDVKLQTGDDHPVSRTTVAGDPDSQVSSAVSDIATNTRMTGEQIDALAFEIVEQIKKRGPFLSLSEFVNRRLANDESAESLSLAGPIEAALNSLTSASSSTNPNAEIQSVFPDMVNETVGVSRPFAEAAKGYRAYGFPGWIRQADILRPLAPVMSARDDTFVIRAYGESRNAKTGTIEAKAWCEAVVQRKADYVDPRADESTVAPGDSILTSEANKRFGRRFSIVSFRWLSPEEV